MVLDEKAAFEQWSSWRLWIHALKFWFLGSGFSKKIGLPFTIWAVKKNIPLKWLLKPLLFDTFCVGESSDEINAKTIEFKNEGFGVILDYAVEAQKSEEIFEKVKNEVMQSILNMNEGFAVVKCSGIASEAALRYKNEPDYGFFMKRLVEICELAMEKDLKLMVDAEETWFQEVITESTKKLMLKHNRAEAMVFNTYQMYLKCKLNELKNDIEWASQQGIFLGVKLVRGAYLQKEKELAQKMNLDSP
ncbi:MAG: proline dehydrogenase family protein, partial [Cytophagales bacterium]